MPAASGRRWSNISSWATEACSRGRSDGLRARMELPVDALESCLIDMRVDLRRGDAGVTEQLLHLSQVRSAGQEMRRKTMSQRMGADVGVGAGAANVALDQLPDRLAPQTLAAAREQEPRRI